MSRMGSVPVAMAFISGEEPDGAEDGVDAAGLVVVERRRGRAMTLVSITPRLRMAVLKPPTPVAPPLTRPAATQTISKSRQSRSCSARAAAQSPRWAASQSRT